jgi:hypothetical protein
MNLFITLLENVNKSRTSANNVSLSNFAEADSNDSTSTYQSRWGVTFLVG